METRPLQKMILRQRQRREERKVEMRISFITISIHKVPLPSRIVFPWLEECVPIPFTVTARPLIPSLVTSLRMMKQRGGEYMVFGVDYKHKPHNRKDIDETPKCRVEGEQACYKVLADERLKQSQHIVCGQQQSCNRSRL